MPWTTPKTWTTGDLVTADDLNTHLRDNLNALRGAVVFNSAASDEIYSITEQYTWEDIDPTDLSLTVTTRGGLVIVGFEAYPYTANSETVPVFTATIDGVRQGGTYGLAHHWVGQGSSEHADQFSTLPLRSSYTYPLAGLSAGSHTITAQWRIAYRDPAGAPSSYQAWLASTANGGGPTRLWVIEYDFG